MKLHNGWRSVNNIVLTLHIVFPVWLLAVVSLPCITSVLLIVAVILCLLVGVVYKIITRLDRLKPVLYVFRGLAIAAMIAVYVPLMILVGFKQTKLLYPVKRAVYTHGVYGENHTYYDRLLPDTLPKECGHYTFRTQGSMVAQDYHPTSWLSFTTDKAALDAYAVFYDRQGYSRITDAGKYRWVMRMFNMDIADDAEIPEGTVFYYISDYYPKAIVLDYAEGRFMVMT